MGTDSAIRIRIKDAVGELRYAPGDQIEGSVEIFPDNPIRCQAVEVAVKWYTEGKGRRDEGIVESQRFDVRQIDPGQGFSEQFRVTLPSTPWSYAGHFINIIWAVHVKIDIPMAPDFNHEVRFLLLPPDVTA
jgi:hypothetical protein